MRSEKLSRWLASNQPVRSDYIRLQFRPAYKKPDARLGPNLHPKKHVWEFRRAVVYYVLKSVLLPVRSDRGERALLLFPQRDFVVLARPIFRQKKPSSNESAPNAVLIVPAKLRPCLWCPLMAQHTLAWIRQAALPLGQLPLILVGAISFYVVVYVCMCVCVYVCMCVCVYCKCSVPYPLM